MIAPLYSTQNSTIYKGRYQGRSQDFDSGGTFCQKLL